MNWKVSASIVIRVKARDGVDGLDGKGVKSTVIEYKLSDSGSVAPSGSWSKSVPTPVKGKYLWTRTTTIYTDDTETVAYSVSYFPPDGAQGLPGGGILRKKWIQGDVHVRNDKVTHALYVERGSVAASDWYMLAQSGTVESAVAPPARGDTPTGYVEISSVMTFAVDLFTAENSNLGGFLFKNNQWWSQMGVDADGAAALYGDEGFIPNLWFDAVEGVMRVRDGVFRGSIEATGGVIGGFKVRDNVLVSENDLVELDGQSGRITIRDPLTKEERVFVVSEIIAATPDQYFGSGGTSSVSISGINGSYGGMISPSTRTASIINILPNDTNTYSINIPPINITAYAEYLYGGQTPISDHMKPESLQSKVTVTVYHGNKRITELGSATATAREDGIDNQWRQTEPRSILISGAGNVTVRVEHTFPTPGPNESWMGSGSGTANVSENATWAKVVDRSIIGSNGMVIAPSATDYFFSVGNITQIRHGNYALRIGVDGVKVASNMNASSPTWRNVSTMV